MRLLLLIGAAIGLASASSTLSPAQSSGIQSTLNHFYSLFTSNCTDWVQVFNPAHGTFYHPKAGVVTGRDNLLDFCSTAQSVSKVQEFRQDGPYTWVSGDSGQVHLLVPAVYFNDAPYVNSEHQFFVLQEKSDLENSQVQAYEIKQVSELLSRSASKFTFPDN
jgi:hypothetical protein